jgi:hypothetical protein
MKEVVGAVVALDEAEPAIRHHTRNGAGHRSLLRGTGPAVAIVVPFSAIDIARITIIQATAGRQVFHAALQAE